MERRAFLGTTGTGLMGIGLSHLLGREAKAVLMVSSYLPELLGVCDRIAVMCRGRLGEARPAADWDEHQLMLAATGQEPSA